MRLWEEFLVQCLVAYGALLAICQSGAFRTQPRVWSHGAVVCEAPLALLARLTALATGVESSFELSPAMLELRSRFVLVAGGASVWPRFRRALVAHPTAFRVLPQLADLERFVARAASAPEKFYRLFQYRRSKSVPNRLKTIGLCSGLTD